MAEDLDVVLEVVEEEDGGDNLLVFVGNRRLV